MHSNDNNWHTLTTEEAAQRLETNPQSGLSSANAAKRLAQYGANELKEKRARSSWRMLLDQFADFMIVVLVGAAVVSGIVGDV